MKKMIGLFLAIMMTISFTYASLVEGSPNTDEDELVENKDMDYSWLGAFGLLGLIGLRRENKPKSKSK